MRNSELNAAVRTFYREKPYALINLCGLSLAIACCLILALYLRSELTYDRHFPGYKQIYRVVLAAGAIGSPVHEVALTGLTLGQVLKEDFPEIKEYVRFLPAFQKVLIRADDKSLYWDGVYSTDKNVFDVFAHKIIYGNPKTAMIDPSSAAVSETFAKRYFGNSNPIGKTITCEGGESIAERPRKITLVFRDLPDNTHLKYDVLLRLGDLPPSVNPRQLMGSGVLFTYLVMPENYNARYFKGINDTFFNHYIAAAAKTAGITWKFRFQPLADIHLDSEIGYDRPTGNKYYVYGFAAVAIFILLVACINYVNLAIARSQKRAKEIGMRRILGVPRINLIIRFLCEAVIFSMIAMIFGVALVELVLKLTPINELFGKSLSLGLTEEFSYIGWIAGLGLLIGLLSGMYPALYLSSISPMSALGAGSSARRGSGFRLREILVLTQFTVSALVIASTLIVAAQMHYIANKPMGFDRHNRVVISLKEFNVIEKYPVIKRELLKDSHILGISVSDRMIAVGQALAGGAGNAENNNTGAMDATDMTFIQIADDFLDVMGIKLATGRNFSKKLLTDVGASFIVNEALVRSKGWKEPLGKRVNFLGINGRVIGVVKDFHFGTLRGLIEPFVMVQLNDDFQNMSAAAREALQRVMIVHVDDKDMPQTLSLLQKKFAESDPKHPFEYAFLDDMIARQYASETSLMKMIGIFSSICIFISCLGLFGLASFTTEQRSKEIGVRKVLGASASQIIIMLSRKTLWLVLVASAVASIAAYFAANEWLAGFAYRIGINPLVFIISAAVVLAVAFITVALQSYKTAQANPATMMRYE